MYVFVFVYAYVDELMFCRVYICARPRYWYTIGGHGTLKLKKPPKIMSDLSPCSTLQGGVIGKQ